MNEIAKNSIHLRSVRIDRFNDLVNEIERCNEIPVESYITNGHPDEKHKLIQECVSLASDLFINDNGTPNYRNITGTNYRITAGEQDSFGWLSGVITCSKGKIVFG